MGRNMRKAGIRSRSLAGGFKLARVMFWTKLGLRTVRKTADVSY